MQGPFVAADNCRGAYLGTRHLIDWGHRRIGILAGFQRLSSMRERLAGFRQALQDNGIPLPEHWVVTSPLDITAAREAMHRLLTLPDPPSAVFINNNVLTLGGLLALRERGVRCPGDISVVCFDDHPWAAVAEPPLTVVRQPSQQLGQVAAEMLLDMIDGSRHPNHAVSLECELIVRQSCSAPPNSSSNAGRPERR